MKCQLCQKPIAADHPHLLHGGWALHTACARKVGEAVRYHDGGHSFCEYTQCKPCSDKSPNGATRTCRFGVVACEKCKSEAPVERTAEHDGVVLPAGWGVMELEAMIDYLRFLCPSCVRLA